MKPSKTWHRVVIGDCRSMPELLNACVHLVVTSPPYYNPPFHRMMGRFMNYEKDYLTLIESSAKEMLRVLDDGRVACIICDDMLIDGEKYPIVADLTKIFKSAGFHYRDKITWRKPEGYIRRSRRSGAFVSSSYPMNFYVDNLVESILIFQKPLKKKKEISKEIREMSKVDLSPNSEFWREKWYLNVWEVTNVLPQEKDVNGIEREIGVFPPEIPYRLIKLYSYVHETVLDPFLGTGTTMQVAKDLGRNSIGYEINKDLIPIIKAKFFKPYKKMQERMTIDGKEVESVPFENIKIEIRGQAILETE